MRSFIHFIEQQENTYVFCDMDGVLTDFDAHFRAKHGKSLDSIPKPKSYEVLKKEPVEWWATMPWKKDGKQLWDHLIKNVPTDQLYILSSPTKDKELKAHDGKLQWLKNNGIEKQIGRENIIIDSDKHKYVKDNGKSILIDDTPEKIEKWMNANGTGVLHKSTLETLKELSNYGF